MKSLATLPVYTLMMTICQQLHPTSIPQIFVVVDALMQARMHAGT